MEEIICETDSLCNLIAVDGSEDKLAQSNDSDNQFMWSNDKRPLLEVDGLKLSVSDLSTILSKNAFVTTNVSSQLYVVTN